MIQQTEFSLKARPRGFHLVTREILEHLPTLPASGLLHLFVKHTSCALSINENADPDVRGDLARIFDRMVKENEPFYQHVLEGVDDMPAHAKSVLCGVELTIPVTRGRLNLGTWQGIYLCEFRDYGGPRHIVATIIGEG
ncbi:MAG: YjbQ family protein [Paraprevotella sp.]|nr:YjbQ family protein [Paraprevotella sp.]MBP3471572.1 YjbQ family protein [Paraprevotella sp.]